MTSSHIPEADSSLPEDLFAVMDESFARDVEEAIAAHREPLNPPSWTGQGEFSSGLEDSD